MKLGFLFGAGVSLACGGPSTQSLTDMMLSGDHVHRDTAGTYFLNEENCSFLCNHEKIAEIRSFLGFLKKHAEYFFQRHKQRIRLVNFEDLYYLVTQLADAVEEYENPAVAGLLESAQQQFKQEDLFNEARQYVKGIVVSELVDLKPTRDHLVQVVEAGLDASVIKLEIFTLNHDLLIEQALERAKPKLDFAYGFESIPPDDLRYWNRQKFERSSQKIRLNKLHGSVDWYTKSREAPGESSRVCIPRGGIVDMHPNGPEILIGTFNKMMEYTSGIHADLFCAFRKSLGEIDRLVISGYSFGDKGVNASIAEWTRSRTENRFLTVSPGPPTCPQTARGAIRRLFDDCKAQIITIDSKFQDVPWGKIREWAVNR